MKDKVSPEKRYKLKDRANFKRIFGFDAPICKSSLAFGKFELDIIKLDTMISGYNGDECTFEGKHDYSIEMAIREKYGEEAVETINKLMS